MGLNNKEIIAKYCLRKKELPLPEELIFEPTSRCNFKCKMCFYNSEYFKIRDKEMSLSEIATCISNLPKTIKRVLLIGGEPLLRRDIADIVRLFSQKKIKVAIVTNGYLLTPALSDELNKIGNIDKIAISLDGPPEINNKIRGIKDAFERSYENLRYAASYFKTEVVSVLQNDNVTALRRLLPYLKEIPNVVFTVEIMRRYTQQLLDDTTKILHMRPEDIYLQASDADFDSRLSSNILFTLLNIKRDAIRMQLKLHTIPENALERIPSLLGKNEIINYSQICGRLTKVRLDSSGKIIQCYALRKPFGSLLEEKLEKIWNSENFKSFRKELVEKNPFPVCSLCFAAEKIDINKIDKQIGIGIVGCGQISHKYAEAIKELKDCFLTGFSSRSTTRGAEFADRYKTYSFSLSELIEKSDALVITTEPSSHLEFVLKIISQKSTHLLIEKPLITQLKEYQELLTLRDLVNNKIFGVSSQERFSWLNQAIKKAIENGKIGIPKFFHIEYSYYRQEDYYKRGSGWRLEKGGDVIFNQGIHIFDFLFDLFGMPSKVFCYGVQIRHKLVPFDTVQILFSYPDDFIGTLGITVAAEPKEPLLSVHIRGTKGALNLNSNSINMQIINSKIDMPWRIAILLSLGLSLFKKYGARFLPKKIIRAISKSILPFPVEHLRKWRPWLMNPHDLKPQIEEFADAIRGITTYRITLEDAYRVIIIAETAYLSLKNNKEMNITEGIIGTFNVYGKDES